MTRGKRTADIIELTELLAQDEDFLRVAMQALVQAALEAEMTQTIGAEKGERTETRLTYRSGYYTRSLMTRVGTLELRVPQDRDGRFSTELFQRYQRSEKALVGTLAEMYVQGGSTRKSLPREGGGQSGDRGLVRPQLLGLGDQRGQQVIGRGLAGLCRAAPERAVPVPDSRRALREGARSRDHHIAGGTARRGGRW